MTAFEPYAAQAIIHSVREKREVTIVAFDDNNHCKAVYQNRLCNAVFNPFQNCFYVDDIYGVICEASDAGAEREGDIS